VVVEQGDEQVDAGASELCFGSVEGGRYVADLDEFDAGGAGGGAQAALSFPVDPGGAGAGDVGDPAVSEGG
jgi:hypothetical protein